MRKTTPRIHRRRNPDLNFVHGSAKTAANLSRKRLTARQIKSSEAYRSMGLGNMSVHTAFWEAIQAVIVKHDMLSYQHVDKAHWKELVDTALNFYACTCKASYMNGCSDTIMKVELVLRDRLKRYRSKKAKFGNIERAYKCSIPETADSYDKGTVFDCERADGVRASTRLFHIELHVVDPSIVNPEPGTQVRNYEPLEQSDTETEAIYIEHITVEDSSFSELIYRVNEVVPENRYVRELRGIKPIDDNIVLAGANRNRLFADCWCPLKDSNIRAFYETYSDLERKFPIVVAVLGRESIDQFRLRNKSKTPRPDSPPPQRSVHMDAPPPPQTFYSNVNDMFELSDLVSAKGLPRTHLGFEQQLAYHRVKVKAHRKVIENLKLERAKLGDDDPIDSDDEHYEVFNEILSEESRITMSFKELRLARAEARQRADSSSP